MKRRKIRMGMVGGGRGAFIGPIHRMAAQLDGQIELVCGAFSSDAKRSRLSGRDLHLPDDRVYADYQEMFDAERARSDQDRMDLVSIVTPNHLHAPVAAAALEAGFHVICDKPLCLDLKEARALRKLVRKSGCLFALTYNYTGYPMVKEARHLVRSGRLGPIRKVVAEYAQGWLAERIEAAGQKQAVWRTDPVRAGASGCMGDIGTHAENLIVYVTGLRIKALCADLTTFVPGRRLDDDGSVLLRFEGGARGVLMASQISAGEENGLTLRVYGEKGGLEWRQEEPNTLIVKEGGGGRRILRAGQAGLSESARTHSRLPAGHPEGYLEAFANIYSDVARTLQARLEGRATPDAAHDFPTMDDGVRGMAFLDAVVRSARSPRKWMTPTKG